MNPATIKLLRDKAMLDFEEGRLPEAEAHLTELIQEIGIPQTAFLKNELCQCLRDRATVYRFANRWQGALDDLDNCEELSLTLGAFAKATLLYNVYLIRAKILSTSIAPVYDRKKALEALAKFRKLGFTDWGADELESDLAFREQNWERAAQLAEKVTEALTKEGWQEGAMSSRLRAGRAYLELENWQRALTEITAAQKFFEKHGPPDQLAAAQMAKARLLTANGKYDTAWKIASQALEGLEGLIRHFRSLFDQQYFFLDKVEYYHQAFAIGLAKGGRQGLVRAWTIAERAKSFYLCQLVANSDVRLFEGVDQGQVSQLGQLEQGLDECESELGGLAMNSQRRPELVQEKQRLSDARRDLLATMMRANPRWAALKTPPPFDLEAELKRLDPAWVPVCYFFQPQADDATLYIFYAGPDRKPHCLQTTWSKKELEKLDQTRVQMRLPKPQRLFLPVFPDELVERVFPPSFVETLQSGQHLLISPHDRLRGIPLHALHIRSEEPLIQNHPIQYIPTLALLPLNSLRKTTKKVLLMACEQDGFGDQPLEEARSEIATLNQLWSAKRPDQAPSTYYIQKDGSPAESGLPLEKWKGFEFIHIACHGVFPEGQPFDAALRLGKDALRASEFFTVRLQASLVSLSACELGAQTTRDSGVRLRGDEWVGLYLPLFYAGAQALLVSLWEADSEKAEQFMHSLHTALSEGASPAKAFQYASQSQSRRRPTLWANWYLVGYPNRPSS